MKIARVVAQRARLQEELARLLSIWVFIGQLLQETDDCLPMFHFDETGALGRIVDHLQAACVLATLLRIELKNSMLDEVFDFGLVHEVEAVRWFHEFERDLVFLTLDTATLRCATLCEGEAILGNDVLERGGHDFGTRSKSDVQNSKSRRRN